MCTLRMRDRLGGCVKCVGCARGTYRVHFFDQKPCHLTATKTVNRLDQEETPELSNEPPPPTGEDDYGQNGTESLAINSSHV
jgi:hypothetical protein